MSDLIVMTFEDPQQAEEVRTKLLRMQRTHLIDLEDAAIVIHEPDGRIRLRQTHNLPLAAATRGTLWGLLVGMLFAVPLLGAAVGAGTGAIAGVLTDIGIDDDLMKEIGASLSPGASALFVLARKITTDKIVDELRPFEGQLLQTSLSSSDEEDLRRALEGAHRQYIEPVSAAPAA